MKLRITPETGMIRAPRMEGKTLENFSGVTKKEKIMTSVLKSTKKGHSASTQKSKWSDIPLVEGKKENKWGQFDVFNVMAKPKISF
jgi:hypothetical protein